MSRAKEFNLAIVERMAFAMVTRHIKAIVTNNAWTKSTSQTNHHQKASYITLQVATPRSKKHKANLKSILVIDENTLTPKNSQSDRRELPLTKMAFGGFIDEANTSVEVLNDLLETQMPLAVDWKIGQIGYTFQLRGLTVKVGNQNGISVSTTSDMIPRKRLDLIRSALREILYAALEDSTWSGMTFGVMLLQMAEEALWQIEDWSESQQRLMANSGGYLSLKSGWDATSSNWQSILSNPFGVNLLTVNDTAQFLLGQSITDILKDLPAQLRVLHVEAVFRDDLVAKFTRKRNEMREHFMTLKASQLRQCINKKQLRQNGKDSVEDMADILSTPKVTFHGAPRHVMQSIVRYGFVVPGQKIGDTDMENKMACGASFGVGIYSSPSIEFASRFARDYEGWTRGWQNPADVPGMRMVVCATLMGRSIQVSRYETRRRPDLFDHRADSHVNGHQNEYIVFDSAQIIPCYVLHLDYGSDVARQHFDMLAEKQSSSTSAAKLKSRLDLEDQDEPDDSPGAKQAKKEALQAAAAKWFPYGFGPATGTNLVIEEIGDISDDEEEYGEFQEVRADSENPYSQYVPFADEKKSWFDEFQTVRTTKKQVFVQ